MSRQIGDRAVVLGASLAGLLAARVLSDAYGQVTVVERDELPETPMHRRGVPHGRHLHALAARGQQAPPLESVQDQIRELLTQREISTRAARWLDESRPRLKIETQLTPEKPGVTPK